MRLPITAHTSRPWRIHDIASDFEVEDVWALPTPGGAGDLPRLVSQFAADRFPDDAPLPVRVVWGARWKIGRRLGWDRRETGVGGRVRSLRHRLPPDLRAEPTGPDLTDESFTSLFLLEDEWASEVANRTVHSIMHVGWVPDGAGGYRGELAVLVKPNGRFGAAYMAGIRPFRRLLVCPALLRSVERGWRAGVGDTKGLDSE